MRKDRNGKDAMRKRLAVAVVVLGAMGGIGTSASAQPKNEFVVACGSPPLAYLVVSGNGLWAVQQAVGMQTHFIPAAIAFTVTDDATGEVVASQVAVKNGHRNQAQRTCAFSDTVQRDGGTFTVRGQAQLVERP
jgi:hypothetical protein